MDFLGLYKTLKPPPASAVLFPPAKRSHQDQTWLIDCLTATLDTSREVRSFAEASLQQASLQPVLMLNVVGFLFNNLKFIFLLMFIKQHWEEGEENFIYPVVSPEEKRIMHQLLLPSLDDPNRKIRTAISMAIVSIAQYDWPDDWPELLPFLLKLISEQKTISGGTLLNMLYLVLILKRLILSLFSEVHGALKCLALLSGELDDTLVPKLLPALYPRLHSIISAPHLYEKSLRTKALAIVHACISVLGSMSGVYKNWFASMEVIIDLLLQTETAGLMLEMVNSLMEQFSIILQPPLQSEDPDEWSMRMEVLKCLLQLVQNFPSLIEARFSGIDLQFGPVILSSLWQTFVSALDVYQISSIHRTEDSGSGRFDSDGNERSLDAFIIQLFETLLTIVGNSKLAKVIGGSIKELVYYTIAFLQMTEEQVHTWLLDANQYVADENDVTYSCRVSGSLLLEEIANAYGGEMIDSIVEAVNKRFIESQTAKVSGATKVNLSRLLDEMVAEDIRTAVYEFPFLHARAFSVVSKFSSVIGRTVREQFLYAAAQAIALDVPPPVKVGACQVLSQVLPDAKSELVQPHIMCILSSLIDLLKQASDETLHLVLETLQAAIKAGHELSRSMEPVISPVILDVWVHHISDPFISIEALEVLEIVMAAKKVDALEERLEGEMNQIKMTVEERISSMEGQVVDLWDMMKKMEEDGWKSWKEKEEYPIWSQSRGKKGEVGMGNARRDTTAAEPRNQPDGLLAGSFDLLTMILKSAPVEVVKAVFDRCFNSTIQVVLESDDHGEMQNATECLAAFLAAGKHELLSWNGDPSFTMKRLLDAASRLLDPNLESSGSLFVGNYVLQLIFHFPSEMAFHIRELVAAVFLMSSFKLVSWFSKRAFGIPKKLLYFPMPRLLDFHGGQLFSVPWLLGFPTGCWFSVPRGFLVALAPWFRAASLVPVVAPSVSSAGLFFREKQ
ncbi:hypothetical protein MA16_Dca018062 [Dendrobium catenatum]|uniref:Importin-9 central HEAT repeats domain-containing protein n=1 Tax=Dendrobium catenatum TaxID=906689 RepID=A0A2I0XHZ6_9ASPA|nr:hypothetical protein MA16_Dca018062 [Dendrobium catenatum]